MSDASPTRPVKRILPPLAYAYIGGKMRQRLVVVKVIQAYSCSIAFGVAATDRGRSARVKLGTERYWFSAPIIDQRYNLADLTYN